MPGFHPHIGMSNPVHQARYDFAPYFRWNAVMHLGQELDMKLVHLTPDIIDRIG